MRAHCVKCAQLVWPRLQGHELGMVLAPDEPSDIALKRNLPRVVRRLFA